MLASHSGRSFLFIKLSTTPEGRMQLHPLPLPQVEKELLKQNEKAPKRGFNLTGS